MSNDKVEVFKAEDFREYVTMTVVGQMPIAAMIARHANRILRERSQVVYSATQEVWVDHHPEPSHTALLIAVEPLRKDSAESLLKEFVEAHTDGAYTPRGLAAFLERARKVLNSVKS
jgi:hypothetical protein